MKIAAYYCRVSSERQEKEATIDSQIQDVNTKIKEDGNNIEAKHSYADNGWSGTTLKRPALDAMRDAAAKKEFQVLYIWDRDRLSRKFSHQELVLDELQDLGIEVIDLHKSVSQNPEEKMMFSVKGLFAEYERIKICERMRRGKMFKARQGIYFSSSVNYGYRYIPRTSDKPGYIEIDPDEAKNVDVIFKLIGFRRLSIRRTIKKLVELGIKPRKSKRGVWSSSTLSQILRDTIYIGKAFYNRTYSLEPEKPFKKTEYKQNKKTSRKLKPKEEWIELPTPRIISDNLFNLVQEQLALNSKFSPRNKKFDYKLAGLIYCSCNERMSGAKSFTQHYYRCISRIKRFPSEDYCKSKGINIQRIEKPVWQAIQKLLTQPELISKQLANWKKSKDTEVDAKKNELTILKKETDRLDEKEKRFTRSYGDGFITAQNYKCLMTEIKDQRININKQIEYIKHPIGGGDDKLFLSDDLLKEAVRRLTTEMGDIDERQILLRLISKVQVDKDQKFVKISGYIPLYYNLNTNQNVTQRTINRYCWFTKCR